MNNVNCDPELEPEDKTMAKKLYDSVVLGGGISGLAAAFYAKTLYQPNAKICLLEKSSHLGGWISSFRTEDGSVHETGTRSIRPAGNVGRNTLDLIDTLGLEDDLLPVTSSHPAARNRFIYADGRIHKLPTGLGSLFRKMSPFSKPLISTILKEPFRQKSPLEDESLKDFFTRRFGSEVADYAVDALCRGVFAGKASELSVRSCFPALYEAERSYRSVILGSLLLPPAVDGGVGKSPLCKRAKDERWSSWSLKDGLQQFPDRLASYIKEQGVDVETETPCTRLELDDKVAVIHTKDGIMETERVFSSLPAGRLAAILQPKHSELADMLSEIKSASVAVINLEFEGKVLPMEGFGYLVPSCEPSQVLGVVFDSCTFPQHDSPTKDTTRLTCMMGGSWFEEHFGSPDTVIPDSLPPVALETIRDHLNIHADPIFTRVNVHKECIPQYTVGHSKRLDSINSYIQSRKLPVSLIGASYNGVAVNDVIYNARRAVLTALKCSTCDRYGG